MKKLNAVIFNDNPDIIDYVFGDENLEKIKQITNFNPTIITPSNINNIDLSEVEAIFSTWGMFVPSDEKFNEMKNLKAIFYAAGATDLFCRPYLDRGIKICSAWKANAIPVAEYCVAQILLGLKNFFNVSRELVEPSKWNKDDIGPGCYGKSVGLIGAGAIALKVKELLESYNINVIIVPSRKENRTISLEEVFANCQVISNHLPDRDDNIGVLNGSLFELMPPKAFFLNTGRGRQVNEDELIATLKKRQDLSAVLDVTFPEPPVETSELYTMPNIYLTPHIAGSLNDEVRRMADYAIEEYLRFLNNEELLYEVNANMLITSTTKN